ncbi:MAG: pyruvate dehydrogenase (acetyl-transferring) component subunit alpha [Bradyrhizobium sp.]|nr:pyruvate dehydrogenase (acetyl-transferring) component subunit alpha [Bradyrhizobium sp.]
MGRPATENSFLLEMAARMLRIRHFEEQSAKLWRQGKIPGGIHLSIGQEGEIVGACMALRPDDYMVGNHRSHGHPIGKGADLRGLMAELMGKVTGVNRGKGGSMHLADFSVGSVGETSIVGSGIPLAVGAALGAQMLGQDRVALCFFGDGASNEGAFHEGLNLAAVWKLPVIFLCENNLYGVTTAIADVSAVVDIADRAAAYAMPGIIVDGQDVLAVHAAVSTAAERARAGDGPSLIEAKTYRYDDHSTGTAGKASYRQPEELTHWRERDPIAMFRAHLVDTAIISDAEFVALDAEALEAVRTAITFANESAYPGPEEAYTNLFAPLRDEDPGQAVPSAMHQA